MSAGRDLRDAAEAVMQVLGCQRQQFVVLPGEPWLCRTHLHTDASQWTDQGCSTAVAVAEAVLAAVAAVEPRIRAEALRMLVDETIPTSIARVNDELREHYDPKDVGWRQGVEYVRDLLSDALPGESRTAGDHVPLEVRSYDGGWLTVVKCSCDPEVLPTSAHWLSAHHSGDEAEGVALLREVVARQRAASTGEGDRG